MHAGLRRRDVSVRADRLVRSNIVDRAGGFPLLRAAVQSVPRVGCPHITSGAVCASANLRSRKVVKDVAPVEQRLAVEYALSSLTDA
jgi:hypothetical protein